MDPPPSGLVRAVKVVLKSLASLPEASAPTSCLRYVLDQFEAAASHGPTARASTGPRRGAAAGDGRRRAGRRGAARRRRRRPRAPSWRRSTPRASARSGTPSRRRALNPSGGAEAARATLAKQGVKTESADVAVARAALAAAPRCRRAAQIFAPVAHVGVATARGADALAAFGAATGALHRAWDDGSPRVAAAAAAEQAATQRPLRWRVRRLTNRRDALLFATAAKAAAIAKNPGHAKHDDGPPSRGAAASDGRVRAGDVVVAVDGAVPDAETCASLLDGKASAALTLRRVVDDGDGDDAPPLTSVALAWLAAAAAALERVAGAFGVAERALDARALAVLHVRETADAMRRAAPRRADADARLREDAARKKRGGGWFSGRPPSAEARVAPADDGADDGAPAGVVAPSALPGGAAGRRAPRTLARVFPRLLRDADDATAAAAAHAASETNAARAAVLRRRLSSAVAVISSARRCPAARRGDAATVAKVWAAEDAGAVVYGSRAAVAGAGAAAAVDALALRPRCPRRRALALHLALRGDSALRGGGVLPAADGDHGGLVEAQLDVVAPCALAADAKAAPRRSPRPSSPRADLANRAGAAPDELSFGGVAEAVDGAAPGPLADAVAVAAAPADAASAAALRALLGLPRVLRAAAPPAAVAAHAAALVDGVEALAASSQAVHFAGAARYLVARLRGGDATARPGDVEAWAPTSLVVAAAAAAVAARLEDADLANGRQPNVSTKVAASRSRAVALAATRDVDDYLRALRRASEVNAHVGDLDMPTHFAVLRWGRPDDAGSPRSARRAGVSDRGLESSPTRRRGTLALPILPT
ncbi:hypothetical protein JL721_5508 [Aureococcus anophagefferens]|nr:hypothetical protein JL721_5508 [Aureococcus anophagefferens]